MCHYITATLPAASNLQLVAKIFDEHKLGFQQMENPHVRKQIDRGDIQILTNGAHCDCGTVLGCLDRESEDQSHGYEREAGRLRKKGWSDHKIQRWIDEKEQTEAKQLREESQCARNRNHEATQWIEFITDVLESGATPRIGLLLHLYHGGIESARIRLLRIESVSRAEIIAELLMKMKEDVIYEFAR